MGLRKENESHVNLQGLKKEYTLSAVTNGKVKPVVRGAAEMTIAHRERRRVRRVV